MHHRYILAHDLGTTGDKATLFDEDGRAQASAFSGYKTVYLHPNWAEQDVQDWWQAVCLATRQLLAETGIERSQVAGIAFSGQMQGCVIVDKAGQPLRSAIIWADTRAVEEAQSVIDKIGLRQAYLILGHRFSSAYTAAKVMWIRRHQPELFGKVHKILQAKDYIIACLTGRYVTDHSDASATNLYDLQARTWSAEISAAAGLEQRLLPEILASTDVAGKLTAAAADALGLAPGTPVVTGGGDGACATLGAGVIDESSAYNYLGSSAWIGVTTAQPVFDPEMRTLNLASLQPGKYYPLGVMQAAGGSYQWLRDTFCLPERDLALRKGISPYELMDKLAMQSKPGAGNLLFLPYLLGERSPYWSEKARGVFVGFSMAHGRPEIVRAVLEGVTFNLRTILEAFRSQGIAPGAMRVIGGELKALFGAS